MSIEHPLYRQSGSPFWYVAFPRWDAARQNFVRKFVSTQVRADEDPDKKKAQKVAAGIVEVAQKVTGMARQGAWSREKALKLVNDLMVAAGLPEMKETPSWQDFANDWKEKKRALVKPATLKIYTRRVDGFSKWLGSRAAQRLDAFGTPLFQGYYQHLMETGNTPATAGSKLGTLREIFEDAFQEEHCTRNAVKKVRRTYDAGRMLKKESFSPEEFRCLLKAAMEPRKNWKYGKEWVTLILLGTCLGGREQDCVRVGWGNLEVTGEKGEDWLLRFKPEKTIRLGTEAEVPVVDPLKSHLQQLRETSMSTLFCPGLAAVPATSLPVMFRAILQRAGIKCRVMVNPKTGRRMLSKTFHSLRHTLVSLLKAAGIDEETRMRIVAHKDSDTHQGYTHVEIKALSEAMEKALKKLVA